MRVAANPTEKALSLMWSVLSWENTQYGWGKIWSRRKRQLGTLSRSEKARLWSPISWPGNTGVSKNCGCDIPLSMCWEKQDATAFWHGIGVWHQGDANQAWKQSYLSLENEHMEINAHSSTRLEIHDTSYDLTSKILSYKKEWDFVL